MPAFRQPPLLHTSMRQLGSQEWLINRPMDPLRRESKYVRGFSCIAYRWGSFFDSRMRRLSSFRLTSSPKYSYTRAFFFKASQVNSPCPLLGVSFTSNVAYFFFRKR